MGNKQINRPQSEGASPAKPEDNTSPMGKQGAYRGNGKGTRGLTAKQEKFAILVAQGGTLSEAYRQAYDAEGMAKSSVWTAASILADVPKVAERINQEVDRIEREKPHDNAASRRLIREYLVTTISDRQQKTSDRTKAAELLGKVAGVNLFTAPEGLKVEKPSNIAEFNALFSQLEKLVSAQAVETEDETPFGSETEEEQEEGVKEGEEPLDPHPPPDTPLGA